MHVDDDGFHSLKPPFLEMPVGSLRDIKKDLLRAVAWCLESRFSMRPIKHMFNGINK